LRDVLIDLGERSYKIHIEAGCLSNIGGFISELFGDTRRKVCVVTGEKVAGLYLADVERSLNEKYDVFPVIVPDGEINKSFNIYEKIISELIVNKFERKSIVIPLGGGVTGDMAGFAAATFLRGVPFVQVPTTIMSQIDSSIGGKVAINHKLGKNLVGSFYQPKGVWIDTRVLKTLDRRERISGIAEAVKHAIIRDRDFFNYIDDNLESILSVSSDEIMENFIYWNCSIKADVVSLDEKESGIRALLNYGHTVGHALEAVTDYERFTHGEAVMLGMIAAGRIAVIKRLLKQAEFDMQIGLISRIGVNGDIDDIKIKDVMELMKHDKKMSDGKIMYVLAEKTGQAGIYKDVSWNEIESAIDYTLEIIEKMRRN